MRVNGLRTRPAAPAHRAAAAKPAGAAMDTPARTDLRAPPDCVEVDDRSTSTGRAPQARRQRRGRHNRPSVP
jgi:hypothetical protein